MATDDREEPGFETDVNELPKGEITSEQTLEEGPQPDADAGDLEAAQKEAAEERKEGGYQ